MPFRGTNADARKLPTRRPFFADARTYEVWPRLANTANECNVIETWDSVVDFPRAVKQISDLRHY
jgi:hypothetical protein